MTGTTEIKRIPRPKGMSNLSRLQQPKEVYDEMIGHYLKGRIPEARTLSAYDFGLLYNIPDGMIQARIKDGLVSGLLQDNDLAQTLEEERLKLLSTSLHRIGDSGFQLDRLLAYLASRVLGHAPNPELIKEMNSAIGNQVRLTETSFKAIGMINQALLTVVQDAKDITKDEALSREAILLELETMKMNGNLDQYLEGTPSLEPHNLAMAKAHRTDTKAAHEFNKALDVEPIPIKAEVIVAPR